MTSSASARGAASRQLADLLLGLAGVMQRLRTLPDGHPAIAAGVAGLERALQPALSARSRLTVEVRTMQLLVEGMETNPDFEPLRDLASQLHEAEIGTIEFLPGVASSELLALLTAITKPNGRGRDWPAAPHILVRTLAPPEAPGTDPWLPLERLLLDDPHRGAATRDTEELAFALEMLPADPVRDLLVLEQLAEIGRAVAGDPGSAEALIRVLATVPIVTLRRLLAPGLSSPAQGALLRSVAGGAPGPVLLRLLEATVRGREGRLSASALHVLARLGRRRDGQDRAVARRALAAELVRLLPDEEVGDPVVRTGRLAPEPERVLKLSLESGILERGTLAAADRLIARRQISVLLALIDTVPREDPVAAALLERVLQPATVRALLDASPVDLEALDRLIPAAGLEAAPALLDGLSESRDRRVRLRLLDLLTRYGTAIGPLATERIDGMPWYVQRNVLALLGRLPDLPSGFTPDALLTHRDPRVRHEAIALAIADAASRERGLLAALDSGYEPTIRLALLALAERCPPEFVPRVIARAADQSLDPDLRALAITAMAPVTDPMVLRLLRRLVVARGITAIGRLAPKSIVMLAALRGLASHWHTHPKVIPLLEAARQSRDPEIRESARPPARRSAPSLPRVVP